MNILKQLLMYFYRYRMWLDDTKRNDLFSLLNIDKQWS